MSLNTLLLALGIALAAIIAWESYWRQEGYPAMPDDSKELWASNRAEVSSLGANDVIAIGSSRIHFDLQKDIWEAETGTRLLMLAADGTPPHPVLEDLIEKSDFKGTLIIGVAPGLFFAEPTMKQYGFRWISGWLDHYYDRTYADRFNHACAMPFQENLSYLSMVGGSVNDLGLRPALERLPIKPRKEADMPPFYNFSYVDRHRNTLMWEPTVTDTAFARKVKNFWNVPSPTAEDAEFTVEDEQNRDTVIQLHQHWVQVLEARGGRVIYLRCPSQGRYITFEHAAYPRQTYWDVLLDATQCKGYHFEDYPQLQIHTLPEWSHMATPDAKVFTRDVIELMKHDGLF